MTKQQEELGEVAEVRLLRAIKGCRRVGRRPIIN
jgi:hypothetical protein